MNSCSSEVVLIQQLQSLECQMSNSISAGVDAYAAFSNHLEHVLSQGRQLVQTGQASLKFSQVLAGVIKPLDSICSVFTRFEQERLRVGARQAEALKDIFGRVSRRRRKRSTRSRKSKAGKNGRVRQSGKKSKRGRRSPVGNPKRRVPAEAESSTSGANHGLQGKQKPTTFDSNGKRCRTVTAPPTDSMKFDTILKDRVATSSSHTSAIPTPRLSRNTRS
ncbi:hypothetical protein BDV93DRAFT_612364 [Ceratobasidium sp. AG-I]|nr:hypothetical protein BDV93DRAFT_612364 [Ceratobasidium sp. AG-I]